MSWRSKLLTYVPVNEQERVDWGELKKAFDLFPGDLLLWRENKLAHMSATAFIVNKSRNQFVAVWHKIYNGWMIPGGHIDGNPDLLAVAKTETQEETGLTPRVLNGGKPFALQILPTKSHYHRSHGYVPAHVHYDVTYLFEAPDNAGLKYAPDESAGIGWLSFADADGPSVVDFMRPVQRKLVEKLQSGRL